MQYAYFVLCFVPVNRTQWSKVSEVVELENRIQVDNFEMLRKRIEEDVKQRYQAEGPVTLEDYRLQGMRAEFDSARDATVACDILEALGYQVEMSGTRLAISIP